MSGEASTHPSFLTLDKAALGMAAAEVRAHIASCDECRGYVASVSEPPPLVDLEQVRSKVSGTRALIGTRARTARVIWLGGGLAVAAAFAVFSSMRPQPSLPAAPSYLGEKGFSSVWIYVRRGNSTSLWDGKKPVTAGDRLRMKIDPGSFRRVEVYSIKNADAPELLFQGEVTRGESLSLPDAWEIDTEPGDERLLVVLSREPVQPVWRDWLRGKAPPGVSLLPFVLPKSAAADSGPDTTSP